jgi:cell division protein FtsL
MNRKVYRGRNTGSKKSPSHGLKPFKLLLLLLLCGIFILGIVGERMSVMEMTIQIDKYEKERNEIETEVKRLELEISHLTSQKRIETIAVETLGMRYPRHNELIVINEK